MYNLIIPICFVRCARLQLLRRVCNKQCSALIDIFRHCSLHETGWSASVEDDLKWLSDAEFANFDANELNVENIQSIVSQKCFRGNIVKCANLCSSNQFSPTRLVKETIGLCSHGCDQCDSIFLTKQKLMLHAFKKHGTVDPIHFCITGTKCLSCMLEFHTRVRLVNHVKRRTACWDLFYSQGPCLSHDQVQELDYESRLNNRVLVKAGHRSHKALKPVFRVCGPLPCPICPVVKGNSKHVFGRGHNFYN